MANRFSFTGTARNVLQNEAKALQDTAARLGASFESACQILLEQNGKCVITGIGKSGQIAQKMASTLSSTGTPSVFLHAGEAMHGDLGLYRPGDPTILISKSGSTLELLRIIPTLRELQSPLIALVSNIHSPLAEKCDVVLDASIHTEADALGIVPTTSALVTLALGDALACALMEAKGFQENDFARYHPAGQLGRNLILACADVMHKKQQVATLTTADALRDAVIKMTEYPLGAACIIDQQERLLGILTDGDIRRALQKYANENPLQTKLADIMTPDPLYVTPVTSLSDAAKMMEDRISQISVLPVLNPQNQSFQGLLRLHDIYQPHLL